MTEQETTLGRLLRERSMTLTDLAVAIMRAEGGPPPIVKGEAIRRYVTGRHRPTRSRQALIAQILELPIDEVFPPAEAKPDGRKLRWLKGAAVALVIALAGQGPGVMAPADAQGSFSSIIERWLCSRTGFMAPPDAQGSLSGLIERWLCSLARLLSPDVAAAAA